MLELLKNLLANVKSPEALLKLLKGFVGVAIIGVLLYINYQFSLNALDRLDNRIGDATIEMRTLNTSLLTVIKTSQEQNSKLEKRIDTLELNLKLKEDERIIASTNTNKRGGK